jgi:hypothetical protein
MEEVGLDMRVFISAPHNRPSGGTKYLNLFVNLFNDKGITSYMVLPQEPIQSDFLNQPAPVIDASKMLEMCSSDDVIIDGWQLDEIYNSTRIAPAYRKIFWHHGCSIPIGKGYKGEQVYSDDSCYTDYWNVSTACSDYIKSRYGVESSVLQLFSPDNPDKLYSRSLDYKDRKGILLLWARGAWRILKMLPKISSTTVTIAYPGYSENTWYDLLHSHRLFVSVDQGVRSTPLWQRAQYRLFGKENNYWKVPSSRLLGFPTPPFEAALCGCAVVGAPMGGGLEWMNQDNCYLAEDLNLGSLLEQVTLALSANDQQLERKARSAFESVRIFDREKTWLELCNLLSI